MNRYQQSRDREYSKLSEAGLNFVAVAQRGAYDFAHTNLCYPRLVDEVQFLIQIARYREGLTDTDREALRELSRTATETSETVEGYVEEIHQPTFYEALGKNLELAEHPEWDIAGDLQWIEEECRREEWAYAIAHLAAVDAEFGKQMVEDKQQGGEGTIS